MNGTNFSEMTAALWVEAKKLFKSRVSWMTFGIFTMLSVVSGFFIFIIKDPELAHRLGLLGDKAELFGGTADWAGLFSLTLVFLTVGGLIVFGFLFIWLFGREYGDKTVYDMLSLPVSRISIVSAKIITGLCWSILLILCVFVLTLLTGMLLGLPGWSGAFAAETLEKMLVTGVFNILLCVPFGLLASMTRSYLPSVGGIFLVLVLGEVFNTIGYGEFFPWAIPSLYSGAAEAMTGALPAPLGIGSYLVLGIVGLAGLVGIGAWWKYADQS